MPNYDEAWYKLQIHAGEQYRKRVAYEEHWPTWRKYYRGEFVPGILPVNYFFSLLRAMVPRVYFKNPSISVSPAMPGPYNAIFAQIQERIDCKLFKMMNIKKQIKKMIQDAFLYGTAFCKLGFGAQFQPSPVGAYTDSPMGPRFGKLEYRSGMLPNMPWLSRIHPRYVIVPDGTEDSDDCPWITHVVERPIEDVKADKRFKNRADLVSSRIMNTQHGAKVEPRELIKLYEVRDRKFGKVRVFSADQEGTLLEATDYLQTFAGFPIFELIFNNDDECFWGVPDSAIIEPQQLEINEIRTLIMKHRRLSIVKILYEKGVLDKNALSALVSEAVMAGVEVGDITKVQFTNGNNIPQELFNADALTRSDLRETIGFSRNQLGEQAKGDTTATEASIVQMASEIRVDERQDIVSDLLTRITYAIHEVVYKFWTEDQVIDIVGPGGIPIWVEFSGKMLSGGAYEVTIEPESAQPETKNTRRARAMEAYNMFKMNPLVNPVELTKITLREMYGVQYNDLVQGLPQGAGTNYPMQVPQLAKLMQNGQRLGLPAPGGQNTGG